MLSLALGGMRVRVASFVGLATTLFLAISAITLFGSLIAAATATPAGSDLGLIGGAFGEIAMVVSLFVVVSTLGFAIRQQRPDLAMLRTIAATPRQVRRLVRHQVLALVVLVSPAAWLAGAIGARRLLTALVARDLAPAPAYVPNSPLPMVVATVVTALVGTGATALAASQVSRSTPAGAMLQSSEQLGRLGLPRAVAGTTTLLGAAALCVFISRQAPDEAAQASLLTALALMLAVGLLGPLLARLVVAVLGGPLRLLSLGDAGGWLATNNLRGHAHRLSSAVVPIAMLVGLSTTFLAITGTVQRAAPASALNAVNSSSDVWLRGVELVVLAIFGAVATVNTLVALTASRTREYALLTLLGATRRRLLRMLLAEAGLISATGVVLGLLVAAPVSVAFALAMTGHPIPSISVGTYGPILAASVALAASTVLLTGVWATAKEPTAVMATP